MARPSMLCSVYRDDAEDGWIPADEVRTELKVADVPTVDSPTCRTALRR